MRRIIEVEPKCQKCGGSLELVVIQMDLKLCAYYLICSCIACEEQNIYSLSLEDFIEITRNIWDKDDKNP
jgi:hypothetical protein